MGKLPSKKTTSKAKKSSAVKKISTVKKSSAAKKISAIKKDPTAKAVAKKKASASKPKTASLSPSEQIDARIEELGDWRGDTLAKVRAIVLSALPDAVEEWKWRGVPVWYHDGIVCTGESYKAVIKLTFAKGASLDDPKKLFNSSLEGNVRRAIDIREGEKIDEKALKTLLKAAAALNARKK